MRFILIFSLVLFAAFSSAVAGIIEIPQDYESIQVGIDAAEEGDTVLVAENTYYENIDFKGKAVTVASHYILDRDTTHISKTIINGKNSGDSQRGSVVYFISGEDTNSVLCGFTITEGFGTVMLQFPKYVVGCGICISASGAKIIHNNIINNQNLINLNSYRNHIFGGGIFVNIKYNDFVIINQNSIKSNSIYGKKFNMGGGIFASGNGGTILINNNYISNNIVRSDYEAANGGGIACYSDPPIATDILIVTNFITGNHTISNDTLYSGGGGIFVDLCGTEINNNVIVGNEGALGGGVAIDHLSHARIVNNTIADNKATIKANGIYLQYSSATIMNSIIWNNSPDTEYEIAINRGFIDVYFSDVLGSYSGQGNINDYPNFLNTQYHLSNTSPCIDAGNPDQQFNDPEDESNPNSPIWPALGTLRCDIGGHGGNPNVLIDFPVNPNEEKFKYGLHKYHNNNMMYHLLIPEPYQESQTYPLILYLHGGGSDSSSQQLNNRKHLYTGIEFTTNYELLGESSFILVPQCPPEYEWWGDCTIPLTIVKSLMDSIIHSMSIDTNRVYVVGYCAGAWAIFEMISCYPEIFAAGIPISAWGFDEKWDDWSKNGMHTPLWIFHGEKENNVYKARWMINHLEYVGYPVTRTTNIDELIIGKAINNKIKLIYTEMENKGHYYTRSVYEHPLLYQWLFKQRKPHISVYNNTLSSNFMQLCDDTLVFNTHIANPSNHSFQSRIYIHNSDHIPEDSILMYDDGIHGDALADDGIYGNLILPKTSEDEFIIVLKIRDFDAIETYFYNTLVRFTTMGPVTVENYYFMDPDTAFTTGDTASIRLTLKNNGQSKSVERITAELVSLDSSRAKVIQQAPRYYQNMDPGETSIISSTRAEDYMIAVSPQCPEYSRIPLRVDISSDGHYFWSDTFSVLVNKATAIAASNADLPENYVLYQNYPNPFNPRTVFSWQVGATCKSPVQVDLSIYNVLGQKVATLVSGKQKAGIHEVQWDASGLASGVYYYRLQAGEFVDVKKLVLLR